MPEEKTVDLTKPSTPEKNVCSAHEMFKNVSTDLTEGGIWLEYSGFRIKVAYTGKSNKKYMASMKRLMKPYKYFLGNDDVIPPKAIEAKMSAAFRQVFAEAIVVDWEGMTDASGVPLPCNPVNVRNILNQLPLLFDDIEEQAGKLRNFREEERKENSEN